MEIYESKHGGRGLKSSHDDIIISAVDDIFYQWDPSTATWMKEVCDQQEVLCSQINLI